MEMSLHHKNYQPPTSLELLFVLLKIVVTLVKDQVHNARNTILLRNDCNYEGKYEKMNYCVLFSSFFITQ